MKTVLLLTSLSPSDLPMVELALNIAAKAESTLLLFHTLLTDQEVQADSPGEDLALREKKLEHLKELTLKASQKLATSERNDYIPEIDYYCNFGDHIDLQAMVTEDVWIVVMGLGSKKDTLNNFVYGTHASQVVNQLNIPVLLVNKKKPLEALEKIALSTDFDVCEIDAIRFLVEFSTIFDSQIILVHDERDPVIDVKESSITVKPPKVKFPKLYYHMIESGVFDKELHILSMKENFNTIAIVSKKGDLFRHMFYSPVTKVLLERPDCSIFVFPYS